MGEPKNCAIAEHKEPPRRFDPVLAVKPFQPFPHCLFLSLQFDSLAEEFVIRNYFPIAKLGEIVEVAHTAFERGGERLLNSIDRTLGFLALFGYGCECGLHVILGQINALEEFYYLLFQLPFFQAFFPTIGPCLLVSAVVVDITISVAISFVFCSDTPIAGSAPYQSGVCGTSNRTINSHTEKQPGQFLVAAMLGMLELKK